MKTIIKVKIRTYRIAYMVGVLYIWSENIALVRDIKSVSGNTARQ